MAERLDIDDLLDRIEGDSESSPAPEGASEEAVAALESKLGRALPPSYRAFLRRFDGGEFRFGRMSGSGGLETPDPRPLPDGLVPVGDDYSGELFCLDYREGPSPEGEVPVVLCLAGRSPERVAGSFLAFISQPYLEPEENREADVTVPGFRKLPYGSWVDIPALEPHGIRMQLLDPEVLDERNDPFPPPESMRRREPPPARERTVALALYNPGNGSMDIPSLGSRAQVRFGTLAIESPSGEKRSYESTGSTPRLLHPARADLVQTVHYLTIEGEIRQDDVLKFVLEF